MTGAAAGHGIELAPGQFGGSLAASVCSLAGSDTACFNLGIVLPLTADDQEQEQDRPISGKLRVIDKLSRADFGG